MTKYLVINSHHLIRKNIITIFLQRRCRKLLKAPAALRSGTEWRHPPPYKQEQSRQLAYRFVNKQGTCPCPSVHYTFIQLVIFVQNAYIYICEYPCTLEAKSVVCYTDIFASCVRWLNHIYKRTHDHFRVQEKYHRKIQIKQKPFSFQQSASAGFLISNK